MKNLSTLRFLALALPLLGLVVTPAKAIDPSSRIVGFNRVICQEGSDTLVTIPFTRFPVFVQKVATISQDASGVATLTPQLSHTLVADEFTTSPHYLRFTSGALAGLWFTITQNLQDSILLAAAGQDVSGVSAGDSFEVIPHWTLATLWPPADQETIHVSDGKLPPDRASSLLFANVTNEGINLSPDRIYFVETTGWFQSALGFPAADDVIVPPGQALVIRHLAGAGDTELFSQNLVHVRDSGALLRTSADGPQDNILGLMRPIPVSLANLGLSSTAFLDSDSTDPADRKDELLLFNNTTALFNRQPSATYFRVGGQWHLDDGSTYPVADDDEVGASTPVVIRKAATAGGASVIWINPFPG